MGGAAEADEIESELWSGRLRRLRDSGPPDAKAGDSIFLYAPRPAEGPR